MLLLVIIYVEYIYVVVGEYICWVDICWWWNLLHAIGVVMLVKACIGICWCGLVKLHEACLLLSSPSSHTLLLLSFISNFCCWILRYSLCGLLCRLLWCFCCIRGDGLRDERKLVPHVLELSRHIVCSRKSRVCFELDMNTCWCILVCLMIVGIGYYTSVFNDEFDHVYAYSCKI